MFRVSKRGIGYYRLVSQNDDYYVSVKHGEKGYEDDEHIHEIAEMICNYLNNSTPKEYPEEAVRGNYEEPEYYTMDGLSPVGAFKKGLISPAEFIGFCKGNVIKYVCRFQSKGSAVEDLRKAKDYINFLLDIYEG